MGGKRVQSAQIGAWRLTKQQHGVISRGQLLELGFSSHAIEHRLADGRLHPIWRGVYAVGRPELTRHGRFIGAVLSCGPEAVLSHASGAALWEIRQSQRSHIEVSVPDSVRRRHPRIVVHRRANLRPEDVTRRHGIPVTTPICTIVDLAPRLTRDQIEAMINEADKRDLVDPETFRSTLEEMPSRPGLPTVRSILDRRTFVLTDSELERRFLRIARRAGLPLPMTGCVVNGFKVDFYWPDLRLVVETDGIRFHRTAAQQERDRLRDHAHLGAGLIPLRFTHGQIRFEPDYVCAVLRGFSSSA